MELSYYVERCSGVYVKYGFIHFSFMQRNGITGVLKDGERDSERRISVMEEKECHKSTAYASRGSACVMQVSRIASITQQLSYEMVLMD